ncbi:MAG: gliding motility-associated ABC transporter substrate-binding protein GldG [Saprospiraceae bacterium]|nr:gliding motility-associated ABC transporter substrate-binding protein GldG [Saprospiraceae bacterium]
MSRSRRTQALLQFGLFAGILLFANILANSFYGYLDLTEEKRFTLTKPTKLLLRELKDRVYVRVLLDGDFPAGFKRLQTATKEMLDDFRSESGYLDYQFENPSVGTVEEVNERRKALADDGIMPFNLRVADLGESSQQLIYPVAIFHYNGRQMVVKLLENNSPSLSPDEVINNSVALLEYKFANVIKKLKTPTRPIILFTRDHGELNDLQTVDLERGLRQFYDTDRITLDSVVQLKPEDCALLVVAKPRSAFSEKDKFKLDQYAMNGGRILWMLDQMDASLDSLSMGGKFISTPYDLKLEDILFKYGVRLNSDVVLDLQCTKIPLQIGQVGNQPQYQLFDWYYHIASQPEGKHPIVKTLDRVEFRFASSMDTLRTKTALKKTVLMRSSQYSRMQFNPVELNFEILKYDPDPGKFDKGAQNLAVLLEGTFPSAFENRVSEDLLNGMKQLGMEFKAASVPTRMIVISDGDVAANFIRDVEKKQTLPLGFNRFENVTYANKDFIINAIEYLIEPSGVIEARSKEVKLRLLDTVRAKEEQNFWRGLNLALPLLFLGAFGWLFNWLRKRRYAEQ